MEKDYISLQAVSDPGDTVTLLQVSSRSARRGLPPCSPDAPPSLKELIIIKK